MLKKIIIGTLVLLALLTIGFFIFINTGVDLPEDADVVIEQVMSAELPILVTGKTGIATNGDVNIWYESKLPTDSVKGTILLVMGLGATALIWDNDFCQDYVDAGYQVVRYDNRDVGQSTWVSDWDEADPYTLEDMAQDGIAVLDAINVDKAHVVGASMGGMIAQTMAINHQSRLASLTSIMSSGFMMDESIPFPDGFNQKLIKLTLKYLLSGSDIDNLKFHIGNQELLKGSGEYPNDMKTSAETTLYELKKRKGYNSSAVDHQVKAIEASGSRLDDLGKITIPTLVIHGISDPLVKIEHAKKYAPLIPNSTTLYIDGMGHDLPKIYREKISSNILETIAKASYQEQLVVASSD